MKRISLKYKTNHEKFLLSLILFIFNFDIRKKFITVIIVKTKNFYDIRKKLQV